jgi:uncharacterized membrane protein
VLDWLLKYPLADYARGKLTFLGGWPLVGVVAAFAIGALLIAAFAWRQRHTLSAQRLASLCGLQSAMLALALLALSQPALLVSSLAGGENTLAVLLDDSASMSFQDGGSTRLAQARKVLASPALARLARRYRLRDYVFAGQAQPVDGYGLIPSPGERTAIGTSVLQVLRELHTSALGAVLLISDGSDSAGAIPDATLDQIAAYGVPVHTIGIGRERMPEDLELEDVLLPARALPGTTVAARVSIRHDGPGTTRLNVYDGNQFLASREVRLPAEGELTSVPISFRLDQPGERELTFALDPKSDEQELRNNTRVRMLEVAEQRASVLYVEGEPRWEYKFMRRALDQDTGVRLVSLLRTSTNGYYRQGIDSPTELARGFPTDRATLYAYDALIIGSMPAAWFSHEQLQMIHDFVSERGGSLLMIAGPEALGDGGWGNTVVGGMLPTRLPGTGEPASAGAREEGAYADAGQGEAQPADGQQADGPDSPAATGESFHRTRVPVELTAAGRLDPMLQFSDDPGENDQLWASLPPVADYQDLGAPRLAATTLLTMRVGDHEQPLLVSEPYGRGRTLILATGGTWRWRMGLPSSDQRHQQFWRQLMRGLVSDVPQPFELAARERGGVIEVRAQLRDAAFAPISDAQITASVSSPQESASFALRALPDQPGVYQALFQPQHSGALLIEASAQRLGASLGSARTTLQYQEGEAEYFSLRQNRGLLEHLAAATGGRYWRPDQLDGLPQAIRASNAGVLEQQLQPLWDAPLLFLLLAALKSAEWLLRRRWGVI